MESFIKKTFKPKLLDIIIFHFPCQDGLSSAWVARKFLAIRDKEHEIIPVQNNAYTNDFLENLYIKVKNKYVAILDFSFNLEITEKINSLAKGLVILDHHITNKNVLEHLDYAYFDMNLSGVGLSWNYFFNKNDDNKIPSFLEMIQDRDLWTWKLPLSKDFCDGFYYYTSTCDNLEESFEYYEELFTKKNAIKKYVELGKILRKKKDKTINGIVKSNKKIYKYQYNVIEYNVQMANCEHEMASDLGSAFCKTNICDFVVLWRYDHNSEKYWCSLRSADKADVSDICKSFGGGGHKNAAGCTLNEHPIKVFNLSNT